ncbi:MAG: hypothetical protein AAGD47_14795, partial [Pseudomonadota bacterium]
MDTTGENTTDLIPELLNSGITYSVYDAETDSILDTSLIDGETITNPNFTIIATPPEEVGSAVFYLNGKKVQTENVIPYTLFGNVGKDMFGRDLKDGDYELKVVFYTGKNGTGSVMVSDTISFTLDTDPGEPEPVPFDATFAVIDAFSNSVVDTDLTDGESVDASEMNLTATPPAGVDVGSVEFYLNGAYFRTENYAPFALFGDKSGDFLAGDLEPGDYEVEAKFYSGKKGGGVLLGTDTVSFVVEDVSEPPAEDPPAEDPPADDPPAEDPPAEDPPEPGFEATFASVDASSNNESDAEITDGETVDGTNMNIVVTPPAGVSPGSVQFVLNGKVVQTENVAPYALFGDNKGDFASGDLENGSYTLVANFYEGKNGGGAMLGSDSVEFVVTNNAAEDPISPTPEIDPDGLAEWADHIVMQFDGNNNDRDDIAAIPIAALLITAGGYADKTTFLYGNNLAEKNDESRMSELDAGGAFAEKLGIDARNYQDDIAGTTARLIDIIETGDKVLMIEGGPMEAAYRALEAVDPKYHSNITLLSHSSWNENRDVITLPGITEARTWADLKADFPDLTFVDIRDQNDGHNNDKGFNNKGWEWMDESDEPLIQEAREIMEPAAYAFNDPSDAGMVLYAMTGIDDGTPDQAKAFFEASDLFDPPTAPGPTGIVAGRFFVDADDDGQNDHDGSDPGVAGFTVQLRKDGA